MAGDQDVPVPRTGFSVARRGYDQAQVDSHLRRLDAEVRMLAADRDAAVAQSSRLSRELDDARSRVEAMQQQINHLAGPPQSVQGMSERLRSMLRLAEDEVAEMHAKADREIAEQRRQSEEHARGLVEHARARAGQLTADAEAHCADLDRRAEERDQAVDEKQTRVERELDELRSTAERERSEAERSSTTRIARQEAEAGEVREQVEHDFRIAMDQRRQEALTSLIAERNALIEENRRRTQETEDHVRRSLAAAHAESEEVRAVARRDADETTGRAERRVHELTQLRARVADQLRATRSLLGAEVVDLDSGPGTAEAREQQETEPEHGIGATNGSRPSPTPRSGAAPHAARS